jgi:hypothetical protein
VFLFLNPRPVSSEEARKREYLRDMYKLKEISQSQVKAVLANAGDRTRYPCLCVVGQETSGKKWQGRKLSLKNIFDAKYLPIKKKFYDTFVAT